MDYLEYSPSPSPFLGIDGEAAYLGPGLLYSYFRGRMTHVFAGDSLDSSHIDGLFDSFSARLTSVGKQRGTMKAGGFGNGLLINSYTYIYNCNLLPNRSGICGWVAGAIVLRYWHARFPSKKVIPLNYLSGNNLKPTTSESNNLASYLRNGRNASSWAVNLRDANIDFAKRQNLGATSTYYLFSPGVHEELRSNRPVVLFGSLPDPSAGGKVNHAVVCYGYTSNGDNIVHYGWKGYPRVVLKSGFVVSNTQLTIK